MMALPRSFPHLEDPAWLLLWLLLPLLVWARRRRLRAGGAGADGLGALTYSRLPVGPAPGWRLWLPFTLRLAALALLIFALARPQLGFTWEENLTEGVDIQIALDVSSSMLAEDFQPDNRLQVAKSVVTNFLTGRGGDRLGLVTFAGAAMTRAPLTVDYDMLRFLVEGVEIDAAQTGTAIGLGLGTAAARLANSPAKSRVVILVTDGANNTGEIDPRSAAAVCRQLGIKVYTIAVGAPGNRPVPVPVTSRDAFGRRSTRTEFLVVPVDLELLAEIARTTGGRAYVATDPATLTKVFGEIDQLEKTELKVKRHVRYQEMFPAFTWAGLSLLLLPFLPAALGWSIEP